MTGREFDDPPTGDQRFDGSGRDRRPTSASEQPDDVDAFTASHGLIARNR